MQKKKKLSKSERNSIYKMLRLKYSFRAIGRELGRSHSTILREVRRNAEAVDRQKDYFVQAQQAHACSHARRSKASKRKGRLKTAVIRHYVELHLREAQWSPEIIAGKLTTMGHSISTEAIYQYIYWEHPDLKACLLVASKPRRRRQKGKRHRRAIIPAAEKRSIESLPLEAFERSCIGHIELDAMLGQRGGSAIQNKVDRHSRKMFLDKATSLKSKPYADLMIERLDKDIPQGVLKTILQDNGSEHAEHLYVDKALQVESFFCHPYCPSERGTVENRNGALRRFFPKGASLDDIPDDYIEYVEDYFNNTPMKVLGFMTPNQVWDDAIKELSQ